MPDRGIAPGGANGARLAILPGNGDLIAATGLAAAEHPTMIAVDIRWRSGGGVGCNSVTAISRCYFRPQSARAPEPTDVAI
jgi:hypothetical protein